MANQAVVGILRTLLTADTAQYETAMKKSAQTADQTGKAIGGIGAQVAKATPQMERMVKAFQGDKLLFQANNLVGAITKVGGAAKLTETEQARVNRTLTEAITKYQALGKQAPKALLDLEQATRRVEQVTKSLGQGANKVFQDIDRLAKGFQGRDAIGEASRLTAAVEKIGGATKLTTAEKAKLNATLREAIEKYRILGQTAPKAMLELEQATRRVVTPTEFLNGKVIALWSAVGSFIGTIAANAVMKLGQLMLDAANNGAKLGDISRSFDRLTRSIGESADAMLNASRGATKGLINDLDLMLSANKAILLGLPVTAQEMADLAKTAVVLGRAMGLDATTALDNLITALGRTSPLILDNLGLTVKLGEANEKYARAVGKLPNALTEAEQKLAFYQAAMEAARKKTEDLGEAELTVSNQLSRIGVNLENYIMGTSRSANESSVFARALGVVADEMERAASAGRDLIEVRNRLDSGQARSPFEARQQLAEERSRELARKGTQPREPGGGFATPELALPAPFVSPKGPTADEIRKIDEAARKLQQRLDDMVALGDSVFGRDLIQRANDFAAVIGDVGNVARITTERQREIHDAVKAAIAVYEQLGQVAPARLLALRDATAAAAAESNTWIKSNAEVLQRLEMAITSATAVGVPMSAVLEEFGNAIDDAVAKARIFGQEVPDAVMRAAAAMGELDAAIRRMPPLDFSEFLRPVPDEFEGWGRVFDAIDSRQQQSLDRRRSASVEAADFELRLAERRGASEQELFALQERLERARLEAAISAENARFEIATRGIDRQSELFKVLAVAHQDAVTDINRQWELGVLERAALFESEAERLGKSIRDQFTRTFTGDLGTLFFGQLGHDPTGELKAAAQEAELEYLRLSRSGRASAKEIQTAFERFRDAEDRANFTFGERFKQLWASIKTTIVNVLNDILDFFVRQFIGGLLKGMASAQLGQRFGQLLTGVAGNIAGGGGIGGGIANVAGSAIPGGVLTGAAGGVGGGALAAGGFTTVNAAGIATTPGFAGAMAPGAAPGAGGALGFLSNPAFWTNPWTIGIAAATALFTWGIAKKGWFRGGEEGVQVNPRRDTFQLQFARAGENVQEAGHRLAAQLTGWTGEPGGGHLFKALQAADSVKEFEAAQRGIVAEFKRHGFNIKSFHTGGFITADSSGPRITKGGAPMTPWHRPLASGERMIVALTGESVLNRETTKALGGKPGIDALNRLGTVRPMLPPLLGAMPMLPTFHDGGLVSPMLAGAISTSANVPAQVINNNYRSVHNHIQGVLDRGSVREVMRDHVYPELNREMLLDQHGFRSSVKKVGTP